MLRRLWLQLLDLAVFAGCVGVILAIIKVTPLLVGLASDSQ